MNWAAWTLVALIVMGTISAVASVGEPREPIDAEGAAWIVGTAALMVLLAVLS